jgi:hypothetical protein
VEVTAAVKTDRQIRHNKTAKQKKIFSLFARRSSPGRGPRSAEDFARQRRERAG